MVRLADDMRKCVVIVGHADQSGSDFRPATTAFLVHAVGEFYYLVTCRHSVVRAGLEDPFFIRFNATNGGSFTHRVENPEWHYHEDRTVDLAVMEFSAIENADIRAMPMNTYLAQERLEEGGDFGPGDLTYTVGLFYYLQGQKRNVPLVHSGHIAAVPADERIMVKDWYKNDKGSIDVEAYIVQTTALEGASGSPVFVRKSVIAADELHSHDFDTRDRSPIGKAIQPNRLPPRGYGATFLLGIWRGSWDTLAADIASPTRYPAGYGVVVPSYRLLELLNASTLLDKRKAAQRA